MFIKALIGMVLILVCCHTPAAERFQISLGTLGSGDWQLRNISLSVDWSETGHSVMHVNASALVVGTHRIENLHLSCPAFELLTNQVDCQNGKLSFHHESAKASSVPASFRYRFTTRELTITANRLTVADGQAGVNFNLASDRWQLNTQLTNISLADLKPLLEEAGLEPSPLAHQGRISGQIALHGDSNGFENASWTLQTEATGYSNAEGTQAAEGLQLSSSGTARPLNGDWWLQASLTAEQGMLYAEPVYLEFSPQQALSVSVDMRWKPDRGEALIKSLTIDQPGILSAGMSATLQPAANNPVQQLELDISQGIFPGLYTTWLQPWLAGGLLDSLETDGRLGGHLVIRDGQAQSVQLNLDALTLHQPGGQFDIRKLSADLDWDDTGAVRISTMGWQAASFYRIQLGAAELALETGAHSVKLQAPLTVPLFDGELQVEKFELDTTDGELSWLLDGLLTPISMQSVSTALDWPPLSGKLSGMIPHASYEKHELTLGGILLVQAFDGDITVHNLRVLDPLGTVPRLWADIRLKHLDLKTLTRTFSFGRIDGRLEGHVDNLYMEVWQPVSFDAAFTTPPGDTSRRRISQRAVDNISNLGGGGVAGAVSRSFLRFLEDFPYKALGIRCRLENGICHMGGVGPASSGSGYYLVQGRWLPPRLDVIGFAADVDWHSLLDRLKLITEGEQAVIK
jgi:hypothetical protein